MNEAEFIKEAKRIIAEYEFLQGLKRIVNDVTDKNGCIHGKDGKFKSKNQTDNDIKYSYLEQIVKMIDLDIDWVTFSTIVHEVNNKYYSEINKYHKKKIIVHLKGDYLYKMKNKGFNNYLFYGKVHVSKFKGLKFKKWKMK